MLYEDTLEVSNELTEESDDSGIEANSEPEPLEDEDTDMK